MRNDDIQLIFPELPKFAAKNTGLPLSDVERLAGR
jgi:hypothetical protein